jgi:hypothetical protein
MISGSRGAGRVPHRSGELFVPSAEKARDAAHFVYAEKAVVIDGAGLVAVRQ